ncbi:MAG TPA: hypothetical protein VM598_08735 [Bdellovibrionota bacterium]|nr:hypothetical protein [Bdellovibrionota bacterium]
MKFPHLTAGYCGKQADSATLNSAYWARFELDDLDGSKLALPQRIPRPDFFRELLERETPSAARSFESRADEFARHHRELLHQREPGEVHADRLINLERTLLRYGRFQQVARRMLPRGLTPAQNLRLAMLSWSARMYSKHGSDASREISELRSIWPQTRSLDDAVRAELAIRLIVYSSRYSARRDLRGPTDLLIRHAAAPSGANLYDQIIKAMALRALPMSPLLTQAERERCLGEMQGLLARMPARTEKEKLVRSELKLTSLQTLAKWNMSHGNTQEAGKYLRSMIELDPFDSTGYSELGLHLYHQGSFARASRSFDRAYRLGPPGLALNVYFRGLCEAEQGSTSRAIRSQRLSSRLDSTALSPMLALFELRRGSSSSAARVIASEILGRKTLASQLEREETAELRSSLREAR